MNFALNTSILVITHDRSNFIVKLAGVLNELGFGGKLIISESSNNKVYAKTSSLLDKLGVKYHLSYMHVPKLEVMSISQSMNASFKAACEKVDTKYSMLTCDDDIPIPLFLEQAEKFLEKNHDYNGVIGDLAWFNLDEKLSRSKKDRLFRLIGLDKQVNCNYTYKLKSHDANGRLNEYLNNLFHTMFALVRTDTHQYIFPKNSQELKFPHFCADYNWMFGIALAGKIHRINQPHVIRQFHGANLSIKGDNHPFDSYLEGMLKDYWGNDSRKFVDYLANLISVLDGINKDEASKYAMEAYRKISILRLGGNIVGSSSQLIKRLNNHIDEFVYRLPFSNKNKSYKKAINQILKYPL